jgi:hypothetical protein
MVGVAAVRAWVELVEEWRGFVARAVLEHAMRVMMGRASGATIWVEDPRGDEGFTRVQITRDWRRS